MKDVVTIDEILKKLGVLTPELKGLCEVRKMIGLDARVVPKVAGVDD